MTTLSGNKYTLLNSVFGEIDLMQKILKSTHKCLIDDVRTISEQIEVDKCG